MSLTLQLDHGRTLAARVAESWLLCDGPAAAAAPAESLTQNGALRPPLKLVWDAAGQTRLRAEWPLGSADEASEALAQLGSLLAAAAPAPDAAELFALAQSAGWPATQRNENLCAVPLEVDGCATALLSSREGAVRAVVEMARLKEAPEVCRQAVAVLLLSAAGEVRFVRPVFAEDGAWLEAAFPATPDAVLLGTGLAALSVAWRLAGREAAALAADPDLAADFLTLRASTLPHFQTKNQNQTT